MYNSEMKSSKMNVSNSTQNINIIMSVTVFQITFFKPFIVKKAKATETKKNIVPNTKVRLFKIPVKTWS